MEERKREREIYGRGETKVSDSEGVKREKVKERERKWERNCFPRKILGKQPIKHKPYFY